ncbi:MAG: acyl-CoA dehydrogenase [Rhodobacterales bacterium]|nr:acyl-CoA dehydrogenase [Rhodobacterales bacterium]
MDLHFTEADEAFRIEIRTWLEGNLVDEFAALKGRGHLGDMDGVIPGRRRWEQRMVEAGWTCVGWPRAHGGRGLSLLQEVIFNEEYARARAPGRLGHIGEGLLGPTLMAFGTPEQQARFLPRIVDGTELWCQGYSEPNAGSDLANVKCRAEPDGDDYRLTGQKVWTSLAQDSDWCFVLARTSTEAKRHHGITCFLIPMDADGINVVPIKQITGGTEFCEVFFDGALAKGEHIIGEVGGGWRVAMGTLAFERGASTLGQQLNFQTELDEIIQAAKHNGTAADPVIRQRIADVYIRLRIMRLNALRTLTGHDDGTPPRAAMITKLYWASWHRDLGELAMDVLGADCMVLPESGELSELQRLFLWTRSDTIYAGTNQIQRNIIGERALGLPR